MESKVILSTRGLDVYFGGLAALKALDVTVLEGQIHGLIGPNGAGKSTFTNAVSGMITPTSGSIKLYDTDITKMSAHAISELGLARTFQRAQVLPKMNCLQNILVGRHPRIKTGFVRTMLRPPFFSSKEEQKNKQQCLELLELVGLAGYAYRMATELVWVECQLLQIARALASEPKLLILDEPTAGMGPEESQIIGKLVRRIRDNGISIVLISHDVGLVMDNADRVTVINFGQKICEDGPDAVQCDEKVLEAYLGSD